MTKQIKVLMVDDEKRFRDTTQKILTKRGFMTILAGSGEEALELISQEPDVVILDIKMPGIDGHETLTRLKKENPDLPVIMLTGHGAKPSAREALIEGAFDYLSKPCDINLLTEKIKEACSGRNNLSGTNERSISSVMIPIEEYTTIAEGGSIREAIYKLKQSFITKLATNQLMETGHRSILVKSSENLITGILTIRDLLGVIMPDYLSAPKPSLADSIEYSPMFWQNMFSSRTREIREKSVADIMSPSPWTIENNSNLMEAAYLMVHRNQRRLLVTRSGRTVGVIREQDLFFEMGKILNY